MQDDEEEFPVKAILAQRTNEGVEEFLVKWLGYDGPHDNTWETLDSVGDTAAMDEWERKAGATNDA